MLKIEVLVDPITARPRQGHTVFRVSEMSNARTERLIFSQQDSSSSASFMNDGQLSRDSNRSEITHLLKKERRPLSPPSHFFWMSSDITTISDFIFFPYCTAEIWIRQNKKKLFAHYKRREKNNRLLFLFHQIPRDSIIEQQNSYQVNVSMWRQNFNRPVDGERIKPVRVLWWMRLIEHDTCCVCTASDLMAIMLIWRKEIR